MNSRRFMSGMGTSSPMRYQRRRLARALSLPQLQPAAGRPASPPRLRYSTIAQDASRHEILIGRRRRVAGPWATRDDVNPARDRGCAETMSRRRHTRLAAPAVAPGIIGFRLVEGAGGCLAAEHEHPPLKYRRRDAAARRGQRRALLPATGCGIVRLVR